MDRSLFIVSSPRSGSSWFVEALARTGVAGFPDEYFRELNYQEVRRIHHLLPDAPLDQVFARLSASRRTGNGVFSAKLMGRQVEPLMRALDEVRPEWRGAGLRCTLETYFGPAIFVWLRRRDLLAQAVSFVKAEQSGQWRQVSEEDSVGGTSRTPQFVFNPLEIAQTRAFFAEEESALKVLFQTQGIQPLELFYEDLVENMGLGIESVLALLGEETGSSNGREQSSLRPQRDAVNAAWRSAYEDWEEQLSPTAISSVSLDGTLHLRGQSDGRLQLVAGQPTVVRCVVRSTASEVWPVGEDALGTGSVGIGLFCFNQERKEIFSQRRFAPLLRPLPPGESTELELFVGPFPEAGTYRLFYQVQQRSDQSAPRAVGAGCGLDLEVLPAANPKAALVAQRNNGGCVSFGAYWNGSVQDLPFHFWRWQEGFGYFQTLGWPWMQHSEHGFWRFFGGGVSECAEAGWWWFDHVLGLCWSSPHEYPAIWCVSAQCWLEFLGMSDQRRRFCCFPTGEIVELPRSEPQFRRPGGWAGPRSI
jgi:LPS sulfotransferase NodH